MERWCRAIFRELIGWPSKIATEVTQLGFLPSRAREGWYATRSTDRGGDAMGVCAQLFLIVMLTTVVLTGCATPPSARKDLLAFFDPGKTTREEVMLRLGQPSGSFEQDRIFTYRIGQYGEEGYYIISPKVVLPAQAASWQNVQFSLVIVFDEHGLLRKHQLVRVD